MAKYEQQLVSGLRGEMGSTKPKEDPLHPYNLNADNYAQLAGEVAGGAKNAFITNPIQDFKDLKGAVSEGDALEAALIGVGYIPEIGQTLKKMGKAAKNDIFVPADEHTTIMAAEDMMRRGDSPDQIWKEHGLVQFDPADGWKKEIPDYDSNFTGNIPRFMSDKTTAGRALDHPELYAAEPDLAGIKTTTNRSSSTGGAYDPNTDSITLDVNGQDKARDVMLHELQHGVQNRYGWATGSDPDYEMVNLLTNLSRGAEDAPGLLDKFDAVTRTTKGWDKMPMKDRRNIMFDAFKPEAQARYLRSGGEAESRLVQLRKDMPPELLRATTPRLEDVLRPQDFKMFSPELQNYTGDRAPIFRRHE